MTAWVLIVLLLMLSVLVGGEICRTIPAPALQGVTNNDDVYRRLDVIGYQQCVKECARSTECGDIRFTKDQLTCILLRNTTGQYSDSLTDQHILSSLGICRLVKCGDFERCVSLTDGTPFCGKHEPWCPTYIDDKCYTLGDDILNWTQSKAACENRGQTLATIDILTTFQRVVNMLKATVVHHPKIYIGGHSIDEDSPWTWVGNGNEINFDIVPSWVDRKKNWRCLMLYLWDDDLRAYSCSITQSYLCQSLL